MVFVVASVAGPLLGGLFVDHVSWRWVFYVNLPIGAAALALTTTALHLPVRRTRARVDYTGAALLAAGLTSVLLVTTWGGREYAWGSAEIAGLAAAAVGLLIAFVMQERRAPEPILPLRLFRDPVFDVVSAVLFLGTLSFFAVIVFMPIFLQVVTGASATDSGLLLLPLLIAATTSTAVSGRLISRTGRYKAFPVAGLALMTVGLLLLSRMTAGTSQATASLLLVVFGLGFGMVSQVLTLAIQNAVDRRDLGIATASAKVFGALFAARLDGAGVDPERVQSSPDAIASASAVADALDTVFLVGAPIAALGVLVVLFLKEVPLRGPGGPKPEAPRPERAARAAA